MMVIVMENNALKELIEICKQHDAIKNCKLREEMFSDHSFSNDATKQYYEKMTSLIDNLLNYIDKYQKEDYVRFSLRFGIVRGIIPRFLKKELDTLYKEKKEWLEFLGETEYKILIKTHMLIEQMHYMLTGEWYTKGFQERLN